MKKITALLGFLGVVSMFSACSETISGPENGNGQANVGTSSASSPNGPSVTSSASTAPTSNSGSHVSSGTDNGSANNTGTRDTTIIKDTVRVDAPPREYDAPYISSGTFCWSEGCSATATSASSAPSATIEVNMSSAIPTPPKISGNTMTDMRDGKSYPIKQIAGKMWMEENINYATNSGYFCKTESSSDMCATYGGFYTYAGALRACPDGWRLPTEAEFEAAIAEQEWKWWKFGGRFKLDGGELTEYGDDKKLGYLWVADSKYIQLKNYADDGTKEYEFHAISERGYNVRCVQD